MSYDPNLHLFGKYRLKDLTITSTGEPNLPTSQYQINNLKWLAKVLEQLEASIGPFAILSAFRSHDVQEMVGPGAVGEGKLSFHEVGMAVDISPLTMTIEEYISKIMNSEWRSKLGEIIFKKDQNSLHLGLPTAKYRGVFKLRENGTYRPMTKAEIEELENIFKMTYAPSSYAANDSEFIESDPSDGLFSDLFLGMFGIYSVGDTPSNLPELENHDPEFEYENKSFIKKILAIAGFGGLASLVAFLVAKRSKPQP